MEAAPVIAAKKTHVGDALHSADTEEVGRSLPVDRAPGPYGGGELSMVKWANARPTMARGDHIHFTRRGYTRIGMGVVDAIMVEFDGDPLTGAAGP